jgi:hypothetical protein
LREYTRVTSWRLSVGQTLLRTWFLGFILYMFDDDMFLFLLRLSYSSVIGGRVLYNDQTENTRNVF